MPYHDTRVCPICLSSFIPKRINSGTCTQTCSKRAENLRAKAKAYNAGQSNITTDTLQAVLRVLEADAAVSAKVAEKVAIRWLESELEDEAQDALDRDNEAQRIKVERQWAKEMGQALQRKRDSGWQPLGSSPSPFKGKAMPLRLNIPRRAPEHAP